jgi:hypothetical protein
MTEHSTAPLDIALAYYGAWTSQDFEQAMTFVADDIVCDGPAGRVEGAEAFRGFMGPFSQILIKSDLIAQFGDKTTAVLMYETSTRPVAFAPGAECLTVADGKITHIRIVFDRTPFDAARAAAATS